MASLREEVSDEGLSQFAESCILGPSILARRLKLDDSTIEQIQFGSPNDRYEQIYQMLIKWKQREPEATWKDLQEATDSGVKRVIKDLYNKEGIGENGSLNHDEEEYVPPPCKVARATSPLPSAPPYELVYPVQEECHETDSNGARGESVTVKRDKSPDEELTYDDDFQAIIKALGHETRWFDLGLALRLKPSLLDEIKTNNREKVADCRKDTIKEWLKNPNQTYKPTWRTLCTALTESTINKALSKRIAQKYNIK